MAQLQLSSTNGAQTPSPHGWQLPHSLHASAQQSAAPTHAASQKQPSGATPHTPPVAAQPHSDGQFSELSWQSQFPLPQTGGQSVGQLQLSSTTGAQVPSPHAGGQAPHTPHESGQQSLKSTHAASHQHPLGAWPHAPPVSAQPPPHSGVAPQSGQSPGQLVQSSPTLHVPSPHETGQSAGQQASSVPSHTSSPHTDGQMSQALHASGQQSPSSMHAASQKQPSGAWPHASPVAAQPPPPPPGLPPYGHTSHPYDPESHHRQPRMCLP
jgi:hypothetical protein